MLFDNKKIEYLWKSKTYLIYYAIMTLFFLSSCDYLANTIMLRNTHFLFFCQMRNAHFIHLLHIYVTVLV
jgi:hypothetical protein